jgi:GNAT superfamily N-acetyltransferase
MTYTLQKLAAMDRPAIKNHYLRLSKEDRHMRFCTTLNDWGIENYIDTILNFETDTVYGVIDGNGRLVAMAVACHIDVNGRKSVEAAFTVDEDERKQGLGKKLMAQIIADCRADSTELIFVSCLRTNKKMQALARSFSMELDINEDEAYAELKLK